MKRKVFDLSVAAMTGVGIGLPITLLCMCLLGGYHAFMGELLVWTIASALFGVLSWLVFYSDRDWSLPVSMAVHGLGCLAVATLAALACGYLVSFRFWMTYVLPVFLVIYVVVYALCIGMMKIGAQQINEKLEQE